MPEFERSTAKIFQMKIAGRVSELGKGLCGIACATVSVDCSRRECSLNQFVEGMAHRGLVRL